jgi:hypothetical protein
MAATARKLSRSTARRRVVSEIVRQTGRHGANRWRRLGRLRRPRGIRQRRGPPGQRWRVAASSARADPQEPITATLCRPRRAFPSTISSPLTPPTIPTADQPTSSPEAFAGSFNRYKREHIRRRVSFGRRDGGYRCLEVPDIHVLADTRRFPRVVDADLLSEAFGSAALK